MNRLPRMIIIIPNTTRTIRVITSIIWGAICSWIVDDCQKAIRCIKNIRRAPRIFLLEGRDSSNQQRVVVHNRVANGSLVSGPFSNDQRRVLDGRHRQEEEVPCARVVQNLHLRNVACDDSLGESRPITLVPAVSNVVDTDPDAKKGVSSGPWCPAWSGYEVLGEEAGLVY